MLLKSDGVSVASGLSPRRAPRCHYSIAAGDYGYPRDNLTFRLIAGTYIAP